MFEYKVVEKKSKGMMGRMGPKDLEKTLNKHAQDGWILDRLVDGEGHRSMSIGKDVFYIVFRRVV